MFGKVYRKAATARMTENGFKNTICLFSKNIFLEKYFQLRRHVGDGSSVLSSDSR
jgi:hypothetical protein